MYQKNLGVTFRLLKGMETGHQKNWSHLNNEKIKFGYQNPLNMQQCELLSKCSTTVNKTENIGIKLQ